MSSSDRIVRGLAAVLAFWAMTSANAATIHLRAALNGAQVPLLVGGTGTGTMTFDTVSKVLSWSVTYSGLSGACTDAHFHGPAPAGVNSVPTVGMTCSASPLTGSSAALNATQEAQLLSGQWYINIHTGANPNGEIRGQVIRVRGDLSGDGQADVLWRNAASGENYLYPMQGAAILGGEGYVRTVADNAWYVAGIGDFDGNGTADLLWRNQITGENYVYFMNGMTISAEGYLRTVADQNWQVTGIGDFNGDGTDDILWRNVSSGENYLYPMNGLTILGTEGYTRTVADQSWHVAGTGDFNGDGRSDILWRNSSSGENYLYPMNGTAILGTEGYTRTVPDQNWAVAGIGDYDGDGRSDILWRNAMTGENYLYPMYGTAIGAGEGYVRTVADAAWQPAGQTSALTPAVAGVRRMLAQMAQTITAQGDALARSHLLGFHDAGFLSDGVDGSTDAGFLANDIRGLAVDSWVPARVVRFDSASQALFTSDVSTENDQGETFKDSLGNGHKRQPDGSWKLWGNRRIADLVVSIQMNTINYGPTGLQEGPIQRANISASAPENALQGITVSGGGVFSDAPVAKIAGTTIELVQADPPPAAPDPYTYDSYFVSAPTALSARTPFTFSVTPAAGPVESYTVLGNTVTDQYVTVSSPTGHALADANLGGVRVVEWQMSSPGFAIERIRLTAYVRTQPAPAAGSQCHVVGQDLPPSTTISGISFPATCDGQAVLEAVFDVLVFGVNGERTMYTYGFRN